MQQLHASLGITTENDKNVRFEAIHMRGTEDMSTEDVLDYFAKYGPFGIEWIDDSCCNIVWVDTISTARALHYVSKPINNLPVRGPCDPFLKEFESEAEKQESGKSVLLQNPNREVQFADEDNEVVENKENRFEGGVDVADISCPIPPGYWRLGKPHTKSKNILLRFAYRTDKKPYKAEKFSEYYKKYGNPNYGGLKGIISESKKQQFKSIFDRNREIQGPKNNEDNKNPWGGLAENWDRDAHFREKEYDNPLAIPDNKPELKNSGLLDRLGFKRAHESEIDEEEQEKTKKKVKVPRMKMYADEEEQKIKRKKQLMALKNSKVETQENDLRSILGVSGVRRRLKPDSELSVDDLGSKLKNRVRNTERITLLRDEEKITRSIVNDRMKEKEKTVRSYERRLHSDRYEKPRRRSYIEEEEEEETYTKHKPRSKVAVVIKTQKKPTVASTVWSRIREKGRFKTAPESAGKKHSSSDSESSSSSNSSGSSSESDESDYVERPEIESKSLKRPGFTNNLKSSIISKISDHKSPLRIEISNEHFKRK